MRSINGKRKNKKSIILIVVSLLLVGGAVGLYLFITSKPSTDTTANNTDTRPANSVEYTQATSEEQAAADQKKQDVINQNETQQGQNATIAISIVRADQAGAGKPLNIRVQIDGVNSGTCEVRLTKDGQVVSRTFEVVYEAGSRYCQDADIPADAFASSGTWDLSIYVHSGDSTSNTIQMSVEVSK